MIIDQGTNLAPGRARNDDISNTKRTPLNKHGGHSPASAFKLGFNNHAFCHTIGISLQLKNFSLQKNGLDQLVEVRFFDS